jgi:hypothetical protein
MPPVPIAEMQWLRSHWPAPCELSRFSVTLHRAAANLGTWRARMRKLAAMCVSAVVLCGTSAQPARADPFVVVAPSIFGFAPDGDGFWFTGAGVEIRTAPIFFGIEGIAGGGCLGNDPVGSPFNCAAGDLIDMSVRTPGEVSMGRGTASINGTTYVDVSFFGDFTFTATPSLFPESSEDVLFFRQPFVFSGMLRGVEGGQDVFNIDLTGTGRTSRAFFRTAEGTYNYQMESLTAYAFDAGNVTVTPEPTSMLLLGTGLAGLFLRAGKRRG